MEFEVLVAVLGLPRADGAPGLLGELLGQRPVELPGAVAQQRGEGGRDGAFGEEAELRQGVQLGVVVLDDFVGGFEFQLVHDVISISHLSKFFKHFFQILGISQ